MKVQNYIQKQLLLYSLMLAIGLIALFLAYILEFESHAMTGVAIGFIPVGIGGILIMSYARKKPSMFRNIEIETDERNSYLRNKTGCTAFWISFWYIFAMTIMSNFMKLPQEQFGLITLFFMIVIYFLILFINIRKY